MLLQLTLWEPMSYAEEEANRSTEETPEEPQLSQELGKEPAAVAVAESVEA